MKIHQVEQLPEGFDFYKSEILSKWDLKSIPDFVDEAWYWYASAPYEGAGHIILRSDDGLWYHHDLGHCSCYGPTERINLGCGQAIEDLLSSCSERLKQELKPLTDAILS